MTLANALTFSCQRYLALMATAAVAILVGCFIVLSSGLTGGQIVSQIEIDPDVLPTNSGDPRTISYLLAQRFAIDDEDIMYIGKTEANQPTKLVQIVR